MGRDRNPSHELATLLAARDTRGYSAGLSAANGQPHGPILMAQYRRGAKSGVTRHVSRFDGAGMLERLLVQARHIRQTGVFGELRDPKRVHRRRRIRGSLVRVGLGRSVCSVPDRSRQRDRR